MCFIPYYKLGCCDFYEERPSILSGGFFMNPRLKCCMNEQK
jgi:hypothetical protein